MVRIAYDPDGDFCVVEGYEEFIEQMDTRGMAEVVDAMTGINYFAHEVGDQIYLLNRHAQVALERLADSLIQEIADKPLH
ncbi:MAG: hypothetical protein ACO1NO_05155 [Burkholderiaceae bacterium]